MIITPIRATIIPKKTFNFGFSLRNSTDKKNIKTGPDEAITGALILSVFCNPKKKKEMFIVTPKKPTKNISK